MKHAKSGPVYLPQRERGGRTLSRKLRSSGAMKDFIHLKGSKGGVKAMDFRRVLSFPQV